MTLDYAGYRVGAGCAIVRGSTVALFATLPDPELRDLVWDMCADVVRPTTILRELLRRDFPAAGAVAFAVREAGGGYAVTLLGDVVASSSAGVMSGRDDELWAEIITEPGEPVTLALGSEAPTREPSSWLELAAGIVAADAIALVASLGDAVAHRVPAPHVCVAPLAVADAGPDADAALLDADTDADLDADLALALDPELNLEATVAVSALELLGPEPQAPGPRHAGPADPDPYTPADPYTSAAAGPAHVDPAAADPTPAAPYAPAAPAPADPYAPAAPAPAAPYPPASDLDAVDPHRTADPIHSDAVPQHAAEPHSDVDPSNRTLIGSDLAGYLPDPPLVDHAPGAPRNPNGGRPPAPPRPVAQLRMPSGDVVDLDRPALIGRTPHHEGPPTNSPPRLITVPSPTGDISRTHVRIEIADGHPLVTDLFSTNGVMVLQHYFPPVRLHPGVPTPVDIGSRVDLGDGVLIKIEPTSPEPTT